MSDQLHLFAIPSAGREYKSVWRLAEYDHSPAGRIKGLIATAKAAERAKFDGVLYADLGSPAFDPAKHRFSLPEDFDPLVAASYVAAHTEKLGIVVSLASTFENPYFIAKRILALDYLTQGRIGWNLITSVMDSIARAIGQEGIPGHADRYAMATEATEIVRSLWDSHASDAVLADRDSGLWLDPARLQPTDYRGQHFASQTILRASRSPQGRPVLVQAGTSAEGIELAARYADLVFYGNNDPDLTRDGAARLKARARALGRTEVPLVLPGLLFVLGSTETEARELDRRITAAIPTEQVLTTIRTYLGPAAESVDLNDLDAPLPPLPEQTEGKQTALDYYRRVAAEKPLTVGEFVARVSNGYMLRHVGTPESTADLIESWFRAGAGDGFIVLPAGDIAAQFEVFADQVVPILQKRGLFRLEYEGHTLRDHLGLGHPDLVAGAA